jgi:hypothetical protein
MTDTMTSQNIDLSSWDIQYYTSNYVEGLRKTMKYLSQGSRSPGLRSEPEVSLIRRSATHSTATLRLRPFL